MDCLEGEILLKWMIWGYPYFRKPPNGQTRSFHLVAAHRRGSASRSNACGYASPIGQRCWFLATVGRGVGNMVVSWNRGTSKSSILMGCSIINQPFRGTPIYGNPHMLEYVGIPTGMWGIYCRAYCAKAWRWSFYIILQNPLTGWEIWSQANDHPKLFLSMFPLQADVTRGPGVILGHVRQFWLLVRPFFSLKTIANVTPRSSTLPSLPVLSPSTLLSALQVGRSTMALQLHDQIWRSKGPKGQAAGLFSRKKKIRIPVALRRATVSCPQLTVRRVADVKVLSTSLSTGKNGIVKAYEEFLCHRLSWKHNSIVSWRWHLTSFDICSKECNSFLTAAPVDSSFTQSKAWLWKTFTINISCNLEIMTKEMHWIIPWKYNM